MLQMQDLFNAELVWRADGEAKLTNPSRQESLRMVRRFEEKSSVQALAGEGDSLPQSAQKTLQLKTQTPLQSTLGRSVEFGNQELERVFSLPISRSSAVQKNPVLPFEISQIDRALPNEGLAFGAMHEFSAYGERKFAPPSLILFSLLRSYLQMQTQKGQAALGQVPEKPFILWIGKRIWPELHSLVGIGGDALRQSLFIAAENRRDLLATCDLALRSRAVKIVVAWIDEMTFAVSRRFALAAQNSGVLFLLVRSPRMFSTKSAASTRWLIEPRASVRRHTFSNRPIDQSAFSLELQSVKGRISQAQSWEVVCGGVGEGHAIALAPKQRVKEVESEAPLVKYA